MSISIPGTKAAPHIARRALRQMLGDAETRDEVLLATSEVVSNAVIHGQLGRDDSIDLSVEVDDERVRVRVVHPGPDFEWDRRQPDRDTPGGFGFHILGSIARRWNVTHRDGRTETWFEI